MGHVRVHSNPFGVPELTFIGMGNPKKRKHSYRKSRKKNARSASHRAPARHAYKKRRRSRKGNPARSRRRGTGMVTKHHYRRSRRRNPGGVGSAMQWLWKLGFGFGGAVGSRSLPQLPFLKTYNTGFIGYAMNGVSAWLLAMLAGKWKGQQAFEYTLFGGLMMTFARAFDDFTGIALAQFISINPGQTPLLQGDAKAGAFLAGVFSSNNFVLPTNTPLAGRRMLPAPAVAAAAAKMAGDSQYLSDGNYLS